MPARTGPGVTVEILQVFLALRRTGLPIPAATCLTAYASKILTKIGILSCLLFPVLLKVPRNRGANKAFFEHLRRKHEAVHGIGGLYDEEHPELEAPQEFGACYNLTMTSEGGDPNKPASALFKLK